MNAGLYQYLFKFQFRKTRHDVHVLLWLRHQNKLEVFGLNCSICPQAAFNEIAMKWCSFRCHQGINRKILEARTIHDGVQNSSSYISPCSIFTVKNLWIRWTGYWICLFNALGLMHDVMQSETIYPQMFYISLGRKTNRNSCMTYLFHRRRSRGLGGVGA